MVRTVDPGRYQARRLAIIDAALTCIASHGFDRTTTASICRAAGIGSGTFFHYFPTKLDVLLAILQLGTAETREWFTARAERADTAAVINEYVDHVAGEAGDPRTAGFVRAVGAMMSDPQVAHALEQDEASVREGLIPLLTAAQRDGHVRNDIPAARLCAWLMVVLDGFISRLTSDPTFDPTAEREMLADTVGRLLAA
jgi:TetR/AcrR family transcriptional regulator, transcriptional repressor of aconitase